MTIQREHATATYDLPHSPVLSHIRNRIGGVGKSVCRCGRLFDHELHQASTPEVANYTTLVTEKGV